VTDIREADERICRVDIDVVAARQSHTKHGTRPLITPLHAVAQGDRLLAGESAAGLTPGNSWAVVVTVADGAGRVGVGTAGFGSEATIPIIVQLAQRVLIGAEPADRHQIWELMHRSTINIARHGVAVHAMSGIDIALWDLFGQQTGRAVYDLLGGKVNDDIPAYASWLYATDDLDRLTDEASRYVAEGFTAVKQRLAFGPADGPAGIRRNIELIRAVQDGIGNGVDHMVDAYMGWDLPYAVRCIRAIEDAGFRLRWVEEALPPDQIDAMTRLRAAISTPLASGEHEAGRHGFHRLLDSGAVDVIQPDANRLGGITEARRVWALGETYGVDVVAHLGCTHNLHLSLASAFTPLVEIMPTVNEGFDEDQVFWRMFPDGPPCVAGRVSAPIGPGLGVHLDEALLDPSRHLSVGDPR
jgi:L-rhamnonate dehydratase